MLNKILTGAVAALTLGGAALTTATPAAAQHYNGYNGGGYHGGYNGGGYYRGGRGYNGGAVLGAGILGLAVGAAIAGHPYRSYYSAPPPSYYYGPSYYSYYGGCHTAYRWDPYYRQYVPTERCY